MGVPTPAGAVIEGAAAGAEGSAAGAAAGAVSARALAPKLAVRAKAPRISNEPSRLDLRGSIIGFGSVCLIRGPTPGKTEKTRRPKAPCISGRTMSVKQAARFKSLGAPIVWHRLGRVPT